MTTGTDPSRRLDRKVAIVTGAANGIGQAIAELFQLQGATVAGYDLSPPPAETQTFALFQQGDVTDADAVSAFVAKVADAFGRVDVLVSNAGMDVFSPPLQTSPETWQRNLDVNLGGHWNFSRAVLPHMLRQQCGSVVNIASVHGHRIIQGAFPYNVAKHALIGMTKALALEYAAQGVRFNSISPGLILVERIERWFDAQPDPIAARQAQEALLPPGRIGQPLEVAQTALFLASDEARFINAADILIDGGRSQVYY